MLTVHVWVSASGCDGVLSGLAVVRFDCVCMQGTKRIVTTPFVACSLRAEEERARWGEQIMTLVLRTSYEYGFLA